MRSMPLLFILMLCAALAPRAQAHAFLDHAEPKVGSTVNVSPQKIKLWFTKPLEAAFSTARVENAQGKQVDKKDVHLDTRNRSLLEVSVPPLSPGKYRVTWRVVSTDTHKTEGHFEFTVR